MRPAGPGDGLRRRFLALPGEQARGRGQIYRPAGEDDHEPLHPLHAVHPLLHRGGGRLRARRDRPRRGHGDHHLPRTVDDLRAAGQRHRPLPGRRADLEALCLQGAALGALQDGVDRRHGRARLQHPRRCARQGGDAHPAAAERARERGVDLRQDAPLRRRARRAAARPAVSAGERQAAAATWQEAFGGNRRAGRGVDGQPHRRDRRRPRERRRDVRAEASDAGARLAEHRLPAGRRGARSVARPRQLHLQRHRRRHRVGRCGAHHRLQPAQGGAGPERPHPQALAARRPSGRA